MYGKMERTGKETVGSIFQSSIPAVAWSNRKTMKTFSYGNHISFVCQTILWQIHKRINYMSDAALFQRNVTFLKSRIVQSNCVVTQPPNGKWLWNTVRIQLHWDGWGSLCVWKKDQAVSTVYVKQCSRIWESDQHSWSSSHIIRCYITLSLVNS